MNYDIIKILNFKEKIKYNYWIVDENNELFIHVKLLESKNICPLCLLKSVSKDYRPINITHSILVEKKCTIVYHAHRFKCKKCNQTFYEENPFTYNHDKISIVTILNILKDLKDPTLTFKAVAERYFVSSQTVINTFDNYVDAHRRTLPSVLCIDEIYTKTMSNSGKYACVLYDFIENKVCDLLTSRHKNYLFNYFDEISEEERKKVKVISIDMWETYRDVAKYRFRNAIVCVDSFHVIKHLNDAVDKIRKKVMQKFNNPDAKSLFSNEMYYYMLKKFKFVLLTDWDDISEELYIGKLKTRWSKSEVRKYLCSIDPDIAYCYKLKEDYREFNRTANVDNAKEELENLIFKFTNSHLYEMVEFGRMLRNWKQEILNSFTLIEVEKNTYKRINNGPIESCNARIKKIFTMSNGYTNFRRFKNRVMYSINKDVPIQGVPKNKK